MEEITKKYEVAMNALNDADIDNAAKNIEDVLVSLDQIGSREISLKFGIKIADSCKNKATEYANKGDKRFLPYIELAGFVERMTPIGGGNCYEEIVDLALKNGYSLNRDRARWMSDEFDIDIRDAQKMSYELEERARPKALSRLEDLENWREIREGVRGEIKENPQNTKTKWTPEELNSYYSV